MKCWDCGKEFFYDGIVRCSQCQPYRPLASGRVQANFRDGSRAEKGKFISQKYYESVQKRKFKKSERTIAEERGEI